MFDKNQAEVVATALEVALHDNNRDGFTPEQIKQLEDARRTCQLIASGDIEPDFWSVDDVEANRDEDAPELSLEDARAILAEFGGRDRSNENETLADLIRDHQ